MEFRCKLGTPDGDVLEGVYVADTEARLRRELEAKGLCVLSLRPRARLRMLSLGGGGRPASRQEFLVFNQELATLIKAGMPLVQSLDILRQRVANETFRGVLDDVYDRVRGGASLSEAFGEHTNLCPPVYAASLMAGERSGDLDTVIRRYVGYEKVIGAVRRRTISALVYPAVLVLLMTVLIGVIVLLVIPAFATFYDSFNQELPLSTRIIMGIAAWIGGHVWGLLAVAAVIIGGSIIWFRQPGRQGELDRLLLRIPWAGSTIQKFSIAQLSRTLATLLGGGLPLVQALDIGAHSMSNRHLTAELEAVTTRVREGQSLAASLRERGVFPDVAAKMVEVGESTGALQDMLNSLADFYDEEIDTEVTRFITLVEPVLLIVTGVVIAVVVLALYMPLFELSSVVGP